MNAKNLLLSLAVAAMAVSCNNGSMTSTKASLKNAADTASYYIGYMYGYNLQHSNMKDPNMHAIVAGMNTALQEKDLEVDGKKVELQQIQMYLNNYFQNLYMKLAEDNLQKGENFLKENAKKSGVDTLTDGIQYKVIKMGEGPKPAATDKVKVNYKGTFLDGKEFDSSEKNGGPVEFPLNRVIPGWTTALQAMPVGSKWIVYLPSEQAYGRRGDGRQIGPNETLIFEIELVDIVQPEDQAETPANNK